MCAYLQSCILAKSCMLLRLCTGAAIHTAAGPRLLEACKALPIVHKPSVRCPTGDAKITKYAIPPLSQRSALAWRGIC